jgi:hypothetical protein
MNMSESENLMKSICDALQIITTSKDSFPPLSLSLFNTIPIIINIITSFIDNKSENARQQIFIASSEDEIYGLCDNVSE